MSKSETPIHPKTTTEGVRNRNTWTIQKHTTANNHSTETAGKQKQKALNNSSILEKHKNTATQNHNKNTALKNTWSEATTITNTKQKRHPIL